MGVGATGRAPAVVGGSDGGGVPGRAPAVLGGSAGGGAVGVVGGTGSGTKAATHWATSLGDGGAFCVAGGRAVEEGWLPSMVEARAGLKVPGQRL